jgi:GNAT superfamily N-acetyltransferase
MGLGKALVHQCTRFARDAGYRKITQWTNSVLGAALCTYVKEGYILASESLHRSFGKERIGETWQLML